MPQSEPRRHTPADSIKLRSRASILDRIDEEWRRSQRWNEPFALLLCDLIAPASPLVTQVVWQEMARIAVRTLREVDVLGQAGPARLCVLLPNTQPAGALAAAERLCGELRGQLGDTALALGLALVPGRDIRSAGDLYDAAAAALLRACASGPFSLCLHQHQEYLVKG
jgi:GGDEF domain-containing protein